MVPSWTEDGQGYMKMLHITEGRVKRIWGGEYYLSNLYAKKRENFAKCLCDMRGDGPGWCLACAGDRQTLDIYIISLHITLPILS